MIKIAFVFDLGRNTEVGEDISAEFGEGVSVEAQPISATVIGPCSTTWCYPHGRTIHLSFRDEMAAADWMREQRMSGDEVDFHLTQQVPI